MRDNGPITQQEYPFPAGKTLVSVTDLKGRIVYANKAFIMVSGYTQDELLGQPHNLIRHPDIPAEAFRDLWDTVDKGLPWTGLVKNRRKNGDHYWVKAHVTPVFRDGTMVGHLSVRTAPERDAVQAAEALYARMREEAKNGALRLVLRAGQLRRADLAAFEISVRLDPIIRLNDQGRATTARTGDDPDLLTARTQMRVDGGIRADVAELD